MTVKKLERANHLIKELAHINLNIGKLEKEGVFRAILNPYSSDDVVLKDEKELQTTICHLVLAHLKAKRDKYQKEFEEM